VVAGGEGIRDVVSDRRKYKQPYDAPVHERDGRQLHDYGHITRSGGINIERNLSIDMARSSRATRAAARRWAERSPATSEIGIRVGSSIDNRDDEDEEGEESSGPGPEASITVTEIRHHEWGHGSVTMGGSTEGSYQTAREEAETEDTNETYMPSGEASTQEKRGRRQENLVAYDTTSTGGRRTTKERKKQGIMDKIEQAVRSMYGQLEVQLVKMYG
jgi:hypothetical protein